MKRQSLVALALLAALSLATFQPIHAADTQPGACSPLFVTGATVAATSAATANAATAAANPTEVTAPNVPTGSLSLSGAFALYPLAQRWSEEYSKANTAVKFDIQAGGAGKGMTDVLAGAVDIAMVSREVRKEETAKGAVAFPVAIDAVVFTINAQNPVLQVIQQKGLPCAALQKIFLSGDQLTWGQIVGTDDATPISVYTRADSAGAAEQAAKYLGGNSQDDIKGIGVQGDPGVVEAVLKDPNGIGYNNIGFAYDPSTLNPIDGIAIVPLDQNGNGAVDADEAIYATRKDITSAIAANKYPSPPARTLFLVTKGKPTGTTLDFLKWVLNDGQALVEDAGYVKVTPDKIQAALDSLK